MLWLMLNQRYILQNYTVHARIPCVDSVFGGHDSQAEMLVKMAESMAAYRPSFIACTNASKRMT